MSAGEVQFFAIALDIDQQPGEGGLVGRQRGTRSAMLTFVGHPVGQSHQFYSSSVYDIGLDTGGLAFLDEQGVEVDGAIYHVVSK
jgi:hypothetical protein